MRRNKLIIGNKENVIKSDKERLESIWGNNIVVERSNIRCQYTICQMSSKEHKIIARLQRSSTLFSFVPPSNTLILPHSAKRGETSFLLVSTHPPLPTATRIEGTLPTHSKHAATVATGEGK